MQTLWLLGGLGLGAGLMYLMDSAKGAGRRERIRGYVGDFGHRAPARPRGRYQADPGPAGAGGPRPAPQAVQTPAGARGTAAHAGHTARDAYRIALVGGVDWGQASSLCSNPGGPQRRASLRSQARAYWRTTDTGHAPQQELRRAWRIYQGRDTQRVDAHTRKPARPRPGMQSQLITRVSCSIASLLSRARRPKPGPKPRTSRAGHGVSTKVGPRSAWIPTPGSRPRPRPGMQSQLITRVSCSIASLLSRARRPKPGLKPITSSREGI